MTEQQSRILLDGTEITHQRLDELLARRYWLSNYEPGQLTLFTPPPYGGSCGHIYGPLADTLGEIHDAWNFGVWSRRAQSGLNFQQP